MVPEVVLRSVGAAWIPAHQRFDRCVRNPVELYACKVLHEYEHLDFSFSANSLGYHR
jgi:hypothetical protein